MQSRIGKSKCVDVIETSSGWRNESSVQKRCDELRCAAYVWSNDPTSERGTAWFCRSDSMEQDEHNSRMYPLWRKGRPIWRPGAPEQELIRETRVDAVYDSQGKPFLHELSAKNSQCQPNKWLNVFSPNPADCRDAVWSDPRCSHQWFNHAGGGDANCGCVLKVDHRCMEQSSRHNQPGVNIYAIKRLEEYAPLVARSVLAKNSVCKSNRWLRGNMTLDECVDAVWSRVLCSKSFFIHRTDGDQLCGCVTNLKADCRHSEEQQVHTGAIIYAFNVKS